MDLFARVHPAWLAGEQNKQPGLLGLEMNANSFARQLSGSEIQLKGPKCSHGTSNELHLIALKGA
jgi:hypothetical protein